MGLVVVAVALATAATAISVTSAVASLTECVASLGRLDVPTPRWATVVDAPPAPAAVVPDDPEAAARGAIGRWQRAGDAPPVDRDAALRAVTDDVIDYDALTRRALGDPCPAATPTCENLWARLDAQQRAEMTSLVTELVRSRVKRHASAVAGAPVAFLGVHPDPDGAVARVATSISDRRHEPGARDVRLDWVLANGGTGWHVVDVVTEGSSLTRNYYTQLRRLMDDPSRGYAFVVERLRQKIAASG